MKSGSVASVAVLLNLGVLAGVTLVREHGESVMSEKDLQGLMDDPSLDLEDLEGRNDITSLLGEGQDSLPMTSPEMAQLFDYILRDQWMDACSEKSKSCVLITVSFTVGSEDGSETSDSIEYRSLSQNKRWEFNLDKLGETKVVVLESEENVRMEVEKQFWVRSTGDDSANLRINWMFNRVWDASKQQGKFMVAVVQDTQGFNCYSKDTTETIGDQKCLSFRPFHVSGYPFTSPFTDPWDALYNVAQIKPGFIQ